MKLYVIVLLAILGAAAAYSSQFNGQQIANKVTSTSTTSMKLFDWKRRGETPLLAGGPRGFSLACTIYVFFYLFLFTLFHLFEQHSVLHIYTLSNTL